VLCYLQELSYEEAARRASCSTGALRGRLERGKRILRQRLARYGLPLAAPVLVLGRPAAVSAALCQATVAALKPGAVPAAGAALARPRRPAPPPQGQGGVPGRCPARRLRPGVGVTGRAVPGAEDRGPAAGPGRNPGGRAAGARGGHARRSAAPRGRRPLRHAPLPGI